MDAYMFSFCRLPLEDIKKKIWRNLKLLEAQGLVTAKNDYQDIVNAIAKVWMISSFHISFIMFHMFLCKNRLWPSFKDLSSTDRYHMLLNRLQENDSRYTWCAIEIGYLLNSNLKMSVWFENLSMASYCLIAWSVFKNVCWKVIQVSHALIKFLWENNWSRTVILLFLLLIARIYPYFCLIYPTYDYVFSILTGKN